MQIQQLKKVQLASINIPGFSLVLEEVYKSMLLNGLSKNTFDNYCRKLADISLWFNKLPAKISEEEMREYLLEMIKGAKDPSQSEFKHTIYGLRYYLKMIGEDMNIKLPSIKRDKRLPVVLSKDECRLLFQLTKNIKHRVILMFIYAGGLRVSELTQMKWSHLDVDRMTLFIKRSKGKKDRYVPLSENLLDNLLTYMAAGSKSDYVFSGRSNRKPMSPTGIRLFMRQAVKRACINKEGVCLHTLRHSYATHLLEDGLDIFSIKELLGHSRIETTLVYLHVGEQVRKEKISPLDTLLGCAEDLNIEKSKEKFCRLIAKRNLAERVTHGQLDIFEGRVVD